MAAGWLRAAPQDTVLLQPMSDGGPGYLEALRSAGGALHPVAASGPFGETRSAHVLLRDAEPESPGADSTGHVEAFIESAQTCGPSGPTSDPLGASSYGLGDVMRQAALAGAKRITIGLGGTCVSDGGAGLLAALGTTAQDNEGDATERLRRGAAGLAGPAGLAGHMASPLTDIDLAPAKELLAGIELRIATDVDVPLLGPRGAARGFSPQKGASTEQVEQIESALAGFAATIGRREDGKDPAVALGAGAAGGLGFALMHLGAKRIPGIDSVMEAVGLDALIASADVILTGEGRFDWQSLQGKVVAGIAGRALSRAKPVVLLAGDVHVGRRELVAAGIAGSYSLSDLVGADRALAEPGESVATAAERIARTWSPSRSAGR